MPWLPKNLIFCSPPVCLEEVLEILLPVDAEFVDRPNLGCFPEIVWFRLLRIDVIKC